MMNKNKVMIYLTSFTVLLSLVTHFLHRELNFLESYLSFNTIVELSNQLVLLLNGFLLIPLILFVIVVFLYRANSNSKHLPLLNMLILTFGSISIIAGGNGLVEYHFSIFMVIAFLAFYDSIKLIIISTGIFAIHHLAGYFFFPELICGTSEYKFPLLLIHAIYLIFTSGANIFLIVYKEKVNKELRAENAQHKEATKQILEKLTYTTNSILTSVKELSVGYEESSHASQHITKTISEMSEEASSQLNTSQTTKKLINGLLENISSIAEKLIEVDQSSGHTNNQSISGKVEIERMSHKMLEIDNSVNDISQLVQNLHQKSKEITEISFLISKISEQTRMLSFNANIEAVRAGEKGKGFAVVANEIGNLAKQTNTSTEAINNLINEITNEVALVNKAMHDGNNVVKEGRTILDSANQVFEDIFQSTNNVKVQTEQIQSASNILLTDSNTVLVAFETMNNTAERTLYRSTQISEASNQQLATMEALENTVASLEELAKELGVVVKDTKEIDNRNEPSN